MQIRFTESVLRNLKLADGARDQQWFDTSMPGFGFRLFASGKANYFVKYKIGKQQRRVTIGPYAPGMLAEMRRQAAELIAQVRRGVDVQVEAKSNGHQVNITLGELLPVYLKIKKNEVRAEWYEGLVGYFNRAWSPFFEKPLRSLDRAALVRHLDLIADKSGRTTADRSRAALSALFSWAIDRGYASSNPLSRLKRYQTGGARKRSLTLRELVAVWKGRPNGDYGRVIGLLILTLQRRDEISDLVWPEIALDPDPAILLPENRTKNEQPHTVPLVGLAAEIIAATPRRHDRRYLFGEGGKGFQGWSKSKARIDVVACRRLAPDLMLQLENLTGDLTEVRNWREADRAAQSIGYGSFAAYRDEIFPHWTLHDLRRTGSTLMNEFGLAEPHIIEAILNHISGASKGGVAGIYNRAKYEDPKRWALERWERFVGDAVAAYDTGGLDAVEAYEKEARKKLRGYLQKSAGSAGSAGIDR